MLVDEKPFFKFVGKILPIKGIGGMRMDLDTHIAK